MAKLICREAVKVGAITHSLTFIKLHQMRCHNLNKSLGKDSKLRVPKCCLLMRKILQGLVYLWTTVRILLHKLSLKLRLYRIQINKLSLQNLLLMRELHLEYSVKWVLERAGRKAPSPKTYLLIYHPLRWMCARLHLE